MYITIILHNKPEILNKDKCIIMKTTVPVTRYTYLYNVGFYSVIFSEV